MFIPHKHHSIVLNSVEPVCEAAFYIGYASGCNDTFFQNTIHTSIQAQRYDTRYDTLLHTIDKCYNFTKFCWLPSFFTLSAAKTFLQSEVLMNRMFLLVGTQGCVSRQLIVPSLQNM